MFFDPVQKVDLQEKHKKFADNCLQQGKANAFRNDPKRIVVIFCDPSKSNQKYKKFINTKMRCFCSKEI